MDPNAISLLQFALKIPPNQGNKVDESDNRFSGNCFQQDSQRKDRLVIDIQQNNTAMKWEPGKLLSLIKACHTVKSNGENANSFISMYSNYAGSTNPKAQVSEQGNKTVKLPSNHANVVSPTVLGQSTTEPKRFKFSNDKTKGPGSFFPPRRIEPGPNPIAKPVTGYGNNNNGGPQGGLFTTPVPVNTAANKESSQFYQNNNNAPGYGNPVCPNAARSSSHIMNPNTVQRNGDDIPQNPFKTAYEQLAIQDRAKGIKRNLSTNASAVHVPGLLRRPPRSINELADPVPTSAPPQKEQPVSDNPEVEELMKHDCMKNVDPKMVEAILNEVVEVAVTQWEDIAGLDGVKNIIKEIIIWPMLRPDIFMGLRGPPKGILLFGPPGTGKTMIGRLISTQSKSTFFNISASSLTSKWIGDGEKMVRALFQVARVKQPAVIFIDEIDSILTQRSDTEHESSRRLKTEFLIQFDGCGTKSDDRILVIGVTNRPQELDEAARRRLVKRIYIPLPDPDGRQQLVRNLLKDQQCDLSNEDYEKIGNLTEGYSGADIRSICQEAAYGPIRDVGHMLQDITAETVRPIQLKDFVNALRHVKASVATSDLTVYEDWDDKFGCHSVTDHNGETRFWPTFSNKEDRDQFAKSLSLSQFSDMTSPSAWYEKPGISPSGSSGDFPLSTKCKELTLDDSDSDNVSESTRKEERQKKYPARARRRERHFTNPQESILTLVSPRRFLEGSALCFQEHESSTKTTIKKDWVAEKTDFYVPDPSHVPSNGFIPSLAPPSMPSPIFSFNVPNIDEIGFGFGLKKSSVSQPNETKNASDVSLTNKSDVSVGFGFIKSDTPKCEEIKVAEEKVPLPQTSDIGFGFGFAKPSKSTKTEVTKQNGVTETSSKTQSARSPEKSLETRHLALMEKNLSVTSFPGNDIPERPRTPFSRTSSVVSGMFPVEVKSPLAKNYPPISPFVIKNSVGRSSNFKFNMDSRRDAQYSSSEDIMRTCSQKEAIPLKLVFENLRDLKKVGEGVYGEVYLGHFGSNTEARVFKIVPVEGSLIINGEKQKKFHEILPEIIISQELSKLADGVKGNFTVGFAHFYGARVCKGKYPESLIKAWKSWHTDNKSDNDCPDFGPGQLYVVFESKYAGIDVEAFEFTSAKQALSAVMQVNNIFAVGECAFEFEHRDAHWGNILVEKTSEEYASFAMNGETFKIPTYGIRITVIDFTMSRVTDGHGKLIFTDISTDEEQFLGTGDLQFDIYRMMRDYNCNNWSLFSPKTNIFWLHYLADKMYFKGRYLDATSRDHTVNLRSLQRLKDLVMDFDSCYNFATSYLSQLATANSK